MTKHIICPNPNCGYRGGAKAVSRGDSIILILLLLVGVIPGLIYLIAASGYTYRCPVCGVKIA